MEFKYTNYADGVHSFRLTKTAEKLNLDETYFGDVLLDVRMDKSPHQIVLDCDLSLQAQMECDRCAENFVSRINSHFQMVYLFGEDKAVEDRINVKVLSPDSDKINLEKDVCEYSILSMPMKRLCKNDCKGLCANCGTNLNKEKCSCKIENYNPVWDKLKNFNNNIGDE